MNERFDDFTAAFRLNFERVFQVFRLDDAFVYQQPADASFVEWTRRSA